MWWRTNKNSSRWNSRRLCHTHRVLQQGEREKNEKEHTNRFYVVHLWSTLNPWEGKTESLLLLIWYIGNMETRKIKGTNHKRYSILYFGYSNRTYVCWAEEALIQFISIKIFMTWCSLRWFCHRVGCMVASMKDINVSAVVCLGYPFKVWCSFLWFHANLWTTG